MQKEKNVFDHIFTVAAFLVLIIAGYNLQKWVRNGNSDGPSLVVNMDDFVSALTVGSDNNGVTREGYVMKMDSGTVVQFSNSYLGAKNTSSSGDWIAAFTSKTFNTGMLGASMGLPSLTPVICKLSTDGEKQYFVQEHNINDGSVTVTGQVEEFTSQGVVLQNCVIS